MTVASLLATSTVFGGMVLFSFGFAAFIFAYLEPRVAGSLIRSAFHWYYTFVLVGSAIAAFMLIFVDTFSAQLLLLTALFGILSQFILMPRINMARDTEGKEALFSRLHRTSVLINFAQLALLVWALIRFV
ncbi:MAG: DUF4149 domain-containing protein [Pseudomonadota bacterium]